MAKIWDTVIVSDIHLGHKSSQATLLLNWLKENPSGKTVLNGDIIDFWRLRRKWYLPLTHRELISYILNERTGEIVYVVGNHDEAFREMFPSKRENGIRLRELRNIWFCNEYRHASLATGKQYLVTHGDKFDTLMDSKYKPIMWLGDIGYDILLAINRWTGLRFSMFAKHKIKSLQAYLEKLHPRMALYAKNKGYDGIICGHTHHPVIDNYDGVEYLNSGDWVESCTALCEDNKGNWKIVYAKQELTNEL